METLRVYGKKDGAEKLLFANLAEHPNCIKTAKKTAEQNGYKISRAIRNGTHRNCFADEDVTEKFLAS